MIKLQTHPRKARFGGNTGQMKNVCKWSHWKYSKYSLCTASGGSPDLNNCKECSDFFLFTQLWGNVCREGPVLQGPLPYLDLNVFQCRQFQSLKLILTIWCPFSWKQIFSHPIYGYISKRVQSRLLKKYPHPRVHYGIILNSQEAEATQIHIGGGVDNKMCRVHRTELIHPLKRKNILSQTSYHMDDALGHNLSETWQSRMGKRCNDSIHMWYVHQPNS